MEQNYFRLSAKLGAKDIIQAVNMHVLVFFVAALFISGMPFSLFAQAPSISYGNNYAYNTGTAITPLIPVIKGLPSGGRHVTTANLGSGFHNPLGVAVDAAGNVYVADNENHQVKKIPFGENNPQIIGSGFKFPADVAVDAAGNVYVADYGNDAIKKIPVGGGTPIIIGSGFQGPTGVAIDTRGNVYVADRSNYAVKEIPANGGAPVTIGSGFNYPTGVAVDPAGNVYVADYCNNAVKEILVNGGRTITLGSGFVHPNGVALDASGNIYVTDEANNAVKMIPVGGGTPIAVGSGFSAPFGITADAAGNIYTGDAGNNAVKKIKQAIDYSISPALPTGLNFDTTTGIITGTPASATPATTYNITANTSAGNISAKLTISVVNLLLPPSINYNDPGKYTAGTAIAPLVPAVTGAKAQGFIIIPALPAGLSFNNTTGVISGTPTEAVPETTYSITAYNSSGRNTAKVNITVTDPPAHPSSTITDPTSSVSTKPANPLSSVSTPPTNNNTGDPNTSKEAATSVTTEVVHPMVQDISEPVVRQAVSPNGDGINDVLTIDNIQSYPDNKLTLMNRSGAEIFQIAGYDNVNKVFDGHSNINHALQQPGTYFYLLEYKANGEVKHKTGFFILKY